MPSTRMLLLPALLAAAIAQPATALEPGGSGVAFKGLLQADANWFDNDLGDLDGAARDDRASGLRRAELVLEGEGPAGFDWVVGHDVKGDKWLDVALRYRPGGAWFLRAGQFKQPSGLEELSSTKNNDFIAKAAATGTFAISRRLGLGWARTADRWSVAASAFGPELTSGSGGNGFGLRATWVPIAGERLLHLGLSYANHDTTADTVQLRARPQADLAALRVVDSGRLANADRVGTIGLETAFLAGRLKLQGEYLRASVQRHGTADYSGEGGYVSALWNLTGERWGYKAGVPTTPGPATARTGLWQAGVRYDRLDLDDGAVRGGRMDALTLGVNWYPRAHLKAMLNLVDVRSERQGLHDDPDVVELRVQLHW